MSSTIHLNSFEVIDMAKHVVRRTRKPLPPSRTVRAVPKRVKKTGGRRRRK